MKPIVTLLMAVLLPLSTFTFTSCVTTDVTGAITSAQAWLNNPANQAMINTIANTAIAILSAFGGTTNATVVGKLAEKYPDVPAGAVAAIAKNPKSYIR